MRRDESEQRGAWVQRRQLSGGPPGAELIPLWAGGIPQKQESESEEALEKGRLFIMGQLTLQPGAGLWD